MCMCVYVCMYVCMCVLSAKKDDITNIVYHSQFSLNRLAKLSQRYNAQTQHVTSIAPTST